MYYVMVTFLWFSLCIHVHAITMCGVHMCVNVCRQCTYVWYTCKQSITVVYISLTDVDECNGTNPCAQTCTNNVGSFTCGCNSGYRLMSNGFDCEGSLQCYLIDVLQFIGTFYSTHFRC